MLVIANSVDQESYIHRLKPAANAHMMILTVITTGSASHKQNLMTAAASGVMISLD